MFQHFVFLQAIADTNSVGISYDWLKSRMIFVFDIFLRKTTFLYDGHYWTAFQGRIKTQHKTYQLKAMQDERNANKYLEMVRNLAGYNEVVFPPCGCSVRKDGDIVMSISWKGILMKAHPELEQVHSSEICI